MRKIFLYLLRKYSKTEKDRLIIYKTLLEQTEYTYYEQTTNGNIQNSAIEFSLAVLNRTPSSIQFLERIVAKAVDAAIKTVFYFLK